MPTKFINQIRTYRSDFTESSLYLPNEPERFCFVLEDIARPTNVKFAGDTCIPEGTYDVSISKSNRFGKDMLLLSNQNDGSIERNGVRFTGIRPHGGNDTEDTHGCPLCAYHSDHKGKVWERASDEIFEYVKEGIADGIDFGWVISSV